MWDTMVSHMGDVGWGWMGLGMVHMLVFWALVIAAIVALVKVFSGSGAGARRKMMSAREILDERYARGEIDKREFEEKSADIAGRRGQR